MKKIIVVLSFVIAFIVLFNKEQIIIPNDSIRIRIIANSNEEIDQLLKIKVKDSINNDLKDLLEDAKTIDEARTLLTENVDKINYKVNSVLDNNNSNMNFKVNYGFNYFPDKTYKGVLYPKGNYESLVIELGEAKGKNFWCVLFPPLCLDEDKEDSLAEVEYKSFIKETLNKYF